jgi:hypothetical protein
MRSGISPWNSGFLRELITFVPVGHKREARPGAQMSPGLGRPGIDPLNPHL